MKSHLCDLGPIKHAFQLLRTEPQQQNAADEKALAKHPKGGNSAFGDDRRFQTSGSH